MAFDLHTVEMINGSTFSDYGKLRVGLFPAVATAAGTGNGVAVSTPIAADLPANYIVLAASSQGAAITVTSKTQQGFNVVQTPATGATLAAGTIDVAIFA